MWTLFTVSINSSPCILCRMYIFLRLVWGGGKGSVAHFYRFHRETEKCWIAFSSSSIRGLELNDQLEDNLVNDHLTIPFRVSGIGLPLSTKQLFCLALHFSKPVFMASVQFYCWSIREVVPNFETKNVYFYFGIFSIFGKCYRFIAIFRWHENALFCW